jgi:hypothetical protein
MTWLIFLSHAFNPLLLSIVLKQQYEEETATDADNHTNIFASVITSLILYLFWLGAHYLIMKIAGYRFDFDTFIGMGKGITYFLPFVLGLVLLIIDYFVRPRLRLEYNQIVVNNLYTIILFFGMYFMLINYMAWLTE